MNTSPYKVAFSKAQGWGFSIQKDGKQHRFWGFLDDEHAARAKKVQLERLENGLELLQVGVLKMQIRPGNEARPGPKLVRPERIQPRMDAIDAEAELRAYFAGGQTRV